MNKETYLKNRKLREDRAIKYRNRCEDCWQPDFSCVCSVTRKFDPNISFVILTHPLEAGKRIATGRIAYNCMKGSYFLRGYDFLKHALVNRLIQDDNNQCFVLYPGLQALELSQCSPADKNKAINSNKKLVIFVIDGTWGNANKMLRLSPNLSTLPKLCFTPKTPSNFRVRKQPKSFCLSTIEAIYELIELLGDNRNFDLQKKEHHNLLHVFNHLVEDQIKKIDTQIHQRGGLQYRNRQYLDRKK